ncbi:MAG: diaminopimelate decarboxylase, partial [Planctomycetota bacterium]
DEAKIRSNCRRLKEAFGKHFEKFAPLYAVKANTNPEVLKIIFSEGWGADCSSEAEAWISKKLGGWGMYTGNYTTEEEFQFLQDSGMLWNLDDVTMLPTVGRMGVPEFLSFRINPGIAQGGMDSLVFAGDDAKYGVEVDDVVSGYAQAKELGAKRFGIHMMTGSNVLDEEYFGNITARLLEIAGKVRQEVDIQFEYINIGGGFGVPYRPEEPSLDIDKVASGVRAAFDEALPKYGLEEPTLMIEPGRWVMADCGWLVGKTHVIKDAKKKFVGIDAGMNDLPRPSIYDAYHHVSVLGKESVAPTGNVNVVGRLCENNDQFAKDRPLPDVEIGDLVVIHNGGAHSYSMGHNYNNRPRSAEYLIQADGGLKKIRRAETFEDLFRTTEV